MRKLIYAAGAAGIAMSALGGGVQPSAAATTYPWCSHGGGSSTGSCGLTTAAQCWATVQGGSGNCQMNPSYEEPAMREMRVYRR